MMVHFHTESYLERYNNASWSSCLDNCLSNRGNLSLITLFKETFFLKRGVV